MKKEIIIYRESLWQSIVADIFTFGILVGSFAINYLFIGSNFLAGILMVCWFIFMIAKSSMRKCIFTDKQKAIDYLNNLKET